MIAEQLNYDPNTTQHAYWESHYELLNTEQRDAYHRIMFSVENSTGGMFMINGHGGTGKTLYKVICSKLRSQGSIVICTASSDIAAILLPGGCTAHSMFKIPIEGLSLQSFCCIPKNSARADLMRAARCIIWDEIVPQHCYAIETLDRTLRDLRDNYKPFGGVTLLMGGDFKQTLPVIPKGSREVSESFDIRHVVYYCFPISR